MNLRIILSFIGLLLLACANPCVIDNSPSSALIDKTQVSLNIARVSRSFVYIESIIGLSQSACDDTGNCSDQFVSLQSSLGSGMTVSRKGKTYVVTAGHVCLPQAYDMELAMISYLGSLTNRITGQSYFGNKSEFEILAVDVDRDVCILKAEVPWISPGLKLAQRMPKRGSKLYMISAPFGIFNPGMALAFDGYLAGFDEAGDVIVSLPTRPGTSGSAILNKNGEVIGVIHSAYGMMENIGIGTSVDSLHTLFEAVE